MKFSREFISSSLARLKVEILDALEPQSVVSLVRICHETFARLSSVPEIKYVLHIEGSSLDLLSSKRRRRGPRTLYIKCRK